VSDRVWRCGRFELPLSRTLVMGIVNVTPDSFSDGGAYAEPLDAIRHARELAAQGADIIDIGGESTRPGSEEVSPAEEIARVRPIVARLASELFPLPISIDTRHADVARACVDAGASIVNDVAGFRDPAMTAVAARSDVGLVVMHMLGEPKTMQSAPHYDHVVAEVAEFLVGRASVLEEAGVSSDRICIDPGIGFGKTLAHNLALLRDLTTLVETGYPVLVGTSRKRFIGEITGEDEPQARLGGSVASAAWAAEHGASVVRVHDVAATGQALEVTRALGGGDWTPPRMG
jgi:dihydropteroate synthase